MDAEQLGARRAREYLARNRIEALASLTFAQYCGIGRIDAKKHYQTKKAHETYALGWFKVGKQFLTLFKAEDDDPYVVEKQMDHVYVRLEAIRADVAALFAYRQDDVRLQTYLRNAQSEIEEAMCDIRDAYQQVKRLNKES